MQYRQTPGWLWFQVCGSSVTFQSYGGSIRAGVPSIQSPRSVRCPEPHGSKRRMKRSSVSISSKSPVRSGPTRCPRIASHATSISVSSASSQGCLSMSNFS